MGIMKYGVRTVLVGGRQDIGAVDRFRYEEQLVLSRKERW